MPESAIADDEPRYTWYRECINKKLYDASVKYLNDKSISEELIDGRPHFYFDIDKTQIARLNTNLMTIELTPEVDERIVDELELILGLG